jgi:hypothetical protein
MNDIFFSFTATIYSFFFAGFNSALFNYFV